MDLHNFALYRGKSIELDKNVESTSPCSQGEDEFSTCGSLHYSSSKNVMSASRDTSVKKLTDTPGKFDSWPNENFTGVEKGDSFSAPGVSVCFGRPMAGLKPGMPKDSESLSFRSNPMSSKTAKRSRMSYQSMQTSCCQVEGCNLDLSSAKDYHRRHRICESHSKSPKVIVAGVERRFCQQCSRFHNLSEFDDKKRSCRRRLSDHNARRRRPQPEALNLSSVGFSSSLYDRRPPNYLLNRMPSSSSDTTWESCCSLKMSQAVNSMIRTSGIDASSANSHLNEATNLPLALSLLSTATWGLNVPESNSLEQIMQATVSIAQPVMQMESQNWQTAEQAPSISPLHSVVLQSTDISHFQDFRLLKPP